ncbi:MAG: amidohydrolase [Acidobacteria bacterium]|nr:MAG: amidohydrolase [Acidobacteriota bacterium]
MRRRDILKAAAGASIATAFGQNRPADFVLRNGKIITLDRSSTIAEAIATAADRIAAVGPNAAMAAFTAPSTRTIDLRGKTVIPGLIDSHAHMDREGLKTVFPSLGRVRSIRDIQNRIAELARQKAPGEWIVTMPIGDPPFYFDVPDILTEKRWPTRQELDAAAPNNPVFIRSIWGFWRSTPPLIACANTEALKRAAITRDTVSPIPELTIEKDANGDPTGVFIEDGMQPTAELIWFRKPTEFSRADRARGIPIAAKAYHAFGTTGVFEGHGVANEVIRAYKDAYRDGALTMRAGLVFSPDWKSAGNAPLESLIESWGGWLGEPASGDHWLRLAGIYANIGRQRGDDVRARASPYTGWAGFNYDTGLPRERLKDVLVQCAKNDIRAVLNYNSPGVIDLLDEVDREVSLKGRRWVVVHINIVSRRDIERIVRMGLVVTSHTNSNIYKEGHTWQARLPRERQRENTPLRDLIDAGVKVGLITDNVPISLFWPIWESVARVSRVTNERIAPEQAITRMEALRCATENAAYLTFDEDKKGSLEPGKFADLAVLSADPLLVAEPAIRDITADMTMVGGKIVHQVPNR